MGHPNWLNSIQKFKQTKMALIPSLSLSIFAVTNENHNIYSLSRTSHLNFLRSVPACIVCVCIRRLHHLHEQFKKKFKNTTSFLYVRLRLSVIKKFYSVCRSRFLPN